MTDPGGPATLIVTRARTQAWAASSRRARAGSASVITRDVCARRLKRLAPRAICSRGARRPLVTWNAATVLALTRPLVGWVDRSRTESA